ncbi:MAG TPA: hypothetical protein VFI23_13110 [Rhizomicrobium sp.]|nr:hypothetical protein [Rhizomicrobium sp.]
MMRSLLQFRLRNPLVWILAVAAGLRLAGLFWGLPASDGWDDDGFAPRNFLTALALTWKQGSYFTYPPLHAILLMVPALPGIAIALLQAPSFHQADVIGEFTKPGFMTYFAVLARLASLAMSLGIVWTVGEMARLAAGGALGGSRTAPIKNATASESHSSKARQAGLLAAGAAALNFGLTYYGQVSNLDVPYLFWGMLALLWGMRAVVEQQVRRFWGAALFAAAGIATKDQAYALFLLSLPLFLLLWFAADRWPRRHASAIAGVLLPAMALALILLLLVDGAVTNPSGFARRIAFLTGPASSDYAAYPKNWDGVRGLLMDVAAWFGTGPAALASLLALAGLFLHSLRTADRGVWVAGLLPALAMLSFTLCFNFIALRSEARFLLPQSVLACVYIGIAAAWLMSAARRWVRLGARAGVALLALAALHLDTAVSAAMLMDPRYDAEAWMRAHVQPGDGIEIFGQNAYLPRFPPAARVMRPGLRPVATRNPLPGVTEIRAPYDSPLPARFIVVSDWWLSQYSAPGGAWRGHRPRVQAALLADERARRYFTALRDGRLGYRLAHRSGPAAAPWPQVHIHESLNEAILIFERAP